MKKYRKKGRLLRLAAAVGMILISTGASSEPVWAAAEQAKGYDPGQSAEQAADDCSDRGTVSPNTFPPGSIILKQNLKEEELQALKQPEASYVNEMGVQYCLTDWEVREVPGADWSRMLEKTEVYREVEGAEKLPPYVDSSQEKDGARISGRLYMQESRILGEEWREDFQVPVTFYSYGADEYELGGIRISGEDILASALAKQELLLGEMGLSPQAYHITAMDWEGESFMDETGQICRRATARGQRLLRDYEAVYKGQVHVTEPVSYEVSAVYEPEALENAAGQRKLQEEEALPAITAVKEANPFSRWIKTGVAVTASLGILGVFLGIILYFTGKNGQKKQEKEWEYD